MRMLKTRPKVLCVKPKPCCRVDAKNLGWWGGVSYTFGALLYNVGSTATLASTWKTFTLNELVRFKSPGDVCIGMTSSVGHVLPVCVFKSWVNGMIQHV